MKLTVKKFIGDDWMVACMVPKGNMMHCMVRETEGDLKQIKYNITAKELPVEIMEVETMLADFFEGGISDIKREGEKDILDNDIINDYAGEILRVTAGGKDLLFTLDKDKAF